MYLRSWPKFVLKAPVFLFLLALSIELTGVTWVEASGRPTSDPCHTPAASNGSNLGFFARLLARLRSVTRSGPTLSSPEDRAGVGEVAHFPRASQGANDAGLLALQRLREAIPAGRAADYMGAVILAAERVALSWVARGLEVAFYPAANRFERLDQIAQEDVLIENTWRQNLALMRPEAVYTGLVLTRTPSGRSHTTYQTEIDGRVYFFRKGYDPSAFRTDVGAVNTAAVRKSMAAFLLNRALGLTQVPLHRWVMVNGELGVLSSSASGGSLLDVSIESPGGGRAEIPDSVHLRIAQCFQFWVNNIDVHAGNLRIESSATVPFGAIQVFDYDNAFDLGLAYGDWYRDTRMGGGLPPEIPRYFVTALERLSPAQIEAMVGPYLTTRELRALLFRREIILEVARPRASSRNP